MSARSDADPQLGRTLGGQYRIEALLGYGGMGRVYRGLQLSVKRAVAIKLIAGQAPYPTEWVQRFRREAEATASLSHPNSVRLFDFGVTETEELYMVMELLDGIDLAHQLQTAGALPLTAALSIARQVLLALCEAHALGITHRDIKPDNIFLANVRGADVVAKVMDFGIAGLAQAQRRSRLTGTGVIIGTPLYMSPEQAQGLPVDGKSDVYSLGVVLFEMLTGRPVFEAETAVNLLLAHVTRAPMRLRESGVELREEASLQALLDGLLAKDPTHRPSAAQALESVTALAARLGVASATGSMRALSLDLAAGQAATMHTMHVSDAEARGQSAAGPRVQLRPGLALSEQDMIAQGYALPQSSADTSALSASPGSEQAPSGRDLQSAPAAAGPSGASTASEQASSGRDLQSARAAAGPSGASTASEQAPSGRDLQSARAAAGEHATGGREFQSARAATAPTSSVLRPTIFIAGAGLVLTAATALALRWVPALFDAAPPIAAAPRHQPAQPSEPEERTVLVSSQPSAAQVLVDGKQVGVTPFELKLRRDTQISVTREGFRRKLINVAYDARSPVFVKLQAEDKPTRQEEQAARSNTKPAAERAPNAADAKRAPLVFSFGQENTASVHARRETTADRPRLRAAPEVADVARKAAPAEPLAPEPAARELSDVAPASGDLYGPESDQDQRAAQVEAEHPQPLAAETTRSAASQPDPIREDELSGVALDSEEEAHVRENYGLRAVGRAVARAFGRLLIPYPNRARRAELADMPLAYPSFREARSAYQRREIDATGFEEAVWQLRERRRREISKQHDLYARGQISQAQYEAHMDRIWDEFWGQRR